MTSPLARLYSRDGKLSAFSLSEYGRCLIFGTNFAALLQSFVMTYALILNTTNKNKLLYKVTIKVFVKKQVINTNMASRMS